jgi:TorA maturation chaperone TorD
MQRADTYGLLAALLAAPPPARLLERLADIAEPVAEGDEGPVGRAWRRLGAAARGRGVPLVSDEYHALFIGLTGGEVTPYGSWYRTGALMDRPLVRLRTDLARLGFARRRETHEPEDHAAALCEVMGLLVVQGGDEAAEGDAVSFFRAHLAPWLPAFFRDLQRAPSARFYAAVGHLGEQFLALESRYLSVPGETRAARGGSTRERDP